MHEMAAALSIARSLVAVRQNIQTEEGCVCVRWCQSDKLKKGVWVCSMLHELAAALSIAVREPRTLVLPMQHAAGSSVPGVGLKSSGVGLEMFQV